MILANRQSEDDSDLFVEIPEKENHRPVEAKRVVDNADHDPLELPVYAISCPSRNRQKT